MKKFKRWMCIVLLLILVGCNKTSTIKKDEIVAFNDLLLESYEQIASIKVLIERPVLRWNIVLTSEEELDNMFSEVVGFFKEENLYENLKQSQYYDQFSIQFFLDKELIREYVGSQYKIGTTIYGDDAKNEFDKFNTWVVEDYRQNNTYIVLYEDIRLDEVGSDQTLSNEDINNLPDTFDKDEFLSKPGEYLLNLPEGIIQESFIQNYIWENYFGYKSLALFNSKDFQTTKHMFTSDIVTYASLSYIDEHSQSLIYDIDGNLSILYHDLMAYIKSYFDLDSINLNNLNTDLFSEYGLINLQKNIEINMDEEYDLVKDQILIQSIEKLEGNYIQVVIDVMNNIDLTRRDYRYTYFLKINDSNQGHFLTFDHSKYSKLNNSIVNVKGDYEVLHLFDDLYQTYKNGQLHYIGEDDEHLYFYFLANAYEDSIKELVVTDKNLTWKKTYEFHTDSSNEYSNQSYDLIINSQVYNQTVIRIKDEDHYRIYTTELVQIDKVDIPEFLRSRINTNSNEQLLRGWDISDDFIWYAYCDEEGLKVYNQLTQETIIIDQHDLNHQDEMEFEAYSYPQFIAKDKYISTRKYGYEWTASFSLYNMISKEFIVFNDAFNQIYNNEQSLYIYYSNEQEKLLGTLFDFKEEKRVLTKIEANYADIDYDQAYMHLVEDTLLIRKYTYNNEKMQLILHNLKTKEEMIKLEFEDYEDYEIEYIVGSFNQHVLIQLPGTIEGSPLIICRLH